VQRASHHKFVIGLALIIITSGSCERQHGPAVGLRDFDQVLHAADEAALHGNAAEIMRSCDLTSVPPTIARILAEGDGTLQVSADYRFVERRVLSDEEHRVYQRKHSGASPYYSAYFRDHPTPEKWNVLPDRWIVYRFDPIKPSEGTSPLLLTVGAFQKSGLWYFSVDYYPFESALTDKKAEQAAPAQRP